MSVYGRGRSQPAELDMDTEEKTERECLQGTQSKTGAQNTEETEEQSERDQLGVLLHTDTQAFSQTREKGRRGKSQ